jgi:hypothetical protein
VNKIYLEFPHKWWPDDKVSSDFIWPKNDKKEFLETYGQVSKYSKLIEIIPNNKLLLKINFDDFLTLLFFD